MATKTALITGCSDGGIGASLATEFHSRGFRVFATARNVDKMKSLAAKGIDTIAMDVTDATSIAATVKTVSEATNRLDVLINNAGITYIMPLADADIDELRRLFDTNVVGAMAVTKAFIPLLAEAKGVVAMLGSISEVLTPCFQVAYAASKAAIHVVASVLRVELHPMGIRVVNLTTGAVKSNLIQNDTNKLPENSFYAPIADWINGRGFMEISKNMHMDTDKYAKKVAKVLLKKRPTRNAWLGGMATMSWFLSRFTPEGILDSTYVKGNHLNTLKKP